VNIEEYLQYIAQVKNAQECFSTDEELYQNANTKYRMNFKEVLSRKTLINLQGLQVVD
jgi:hypothetical protein